MSFDVVETFDIFDFIPTDNSRKVKEIMYASMFDTLEYKSNPQNNKEPKVCNKYYYIDDGKISSKNWYGDSGDQLVFVRKGVDNMDDLNRVQYQINKDAKIGVFQLDGNLICINKLTLEQCASIIKSLKSKGLRVPKRINIQYELQGGLE